jgi:hypothetical protein
VMAPKSGCAGAAMGNGSRIRAVKMHTRGRAPMVRMPGSYLDPIPAKAIEFLADPRGGPPWRCPSRSRPR